jgi:hypothetical protein
MSNLLFLQQAVTAHIKSKDVYIDFVPGSIFRKVGSNEIFYTIPKGDADGGWIITNPRIDKEIVNETGSRYEQFKNSIRLFKYIFKVSYNVKISSYAVESTHIDFERKWIYVNSLDKNLGYLLVPRHP